MEMKKVYLDKFNYDLSKFGSGEGTDKERGEMALRLAYYFLDYAANRGAFIIDDGGRNTFYGSGEDDL